MTTREISANRKAANWQAICEGRDLLQELETVRRDLEVELRKAIAESIMNPPDLYDRRIGIGNSGFCAGDTLDWL